MMVIKKVSNNPYFFSEYRFRLQPGCIQRICKGAETGAYGEEQKN